MYIFDSSAVGIVLKRLRGRAVEVLEGRTALDLTGYELGNVVWKEFALKGVVDQEGATERAGGIAKIMGSMVKEEVESSEGFKGVMGLATLLRLTFYDASYLYIAKTKGLTLVTEDGELQEKARRAGVDAISISEFTKGT